MKQLTQLLGFTAILLFLTSIIWRVNRLEGHDLFFTIAGIFLCLYLPFGILDYKKSQLGKYTPDTIALSLSIFAISLGILFKIQHISFGTLTLLIGEIIFCCLYLPLYVYRQIKLKGNPVLFISAALGIMMFPLGIYLRINSGIEWGFKVFFAAIPLIFILFLPQYFLQHKKNPESFPIKPEKLIFWMALGIIIYFFVFRTVYPPK